MGGKMKDNREFIKALEKSGDLVRIKKEIDWELEMGAITRRANELQAPAVLFEKVKDYPGSTVFGTPMATYRRVAVALGLDAGISVRDLYAEYESRIQHPIKPQVVKTGPCKENKLFGDDIDLHIFPAPYVHDGDGGRYIGTWHINVSKDPDSDWVNWATHRLMLYSKRQFSGLWRVVGDLGQVFYKKYVPQNKPMPLAVAIGADPVSSIAALSPFDLGESEGDYAGALMQAPIEVVKCETNDLYVPAHSEIILEGEILPNVKVLDGPFGEYTGFRTSGEFKEVCRVNAVTFRNKPIFTMSNMGMPYDECAIANTLTTAVAVKRELRKAELPVTDVYNPPSMVSMITIVGVKATAPNIAQKVNDVLHERRTWVPKVIVVDDDVDVFNVEQVLHALATKCHPVRGIKTSPLNLPSPLIPFLSPQERATGKMATALFDCTWPVEWSRETDVPPRVSFQEVYPKKLRDKVLKEWKDYGFK